MTTNFDPTDRSYVADLNRHQSKTWERKCELWKEGFVEFEESVDEEDGHSKRELVEKLKATVAWITQSASGWKLSRQQSSSSKNSGANISAANLQPPPS